MTEPARMNLADRDEPSVIIELTPSTKIITDLTRVPTEMRAAVCTVAESRWDLTPLVHKKTLVKTTGASYLSINFDTFPPVYRDTAKRLMWAYINVATPVAELERATATRTQLSATSVGVSAWLIRRWMDWLVDRNIERFTDVTEADFSDYCDELRAGGNARETVGYRLFAVTRAWLYAPYLPPNDRLPRPSWEGGKSERTDVMGPANWSSENKTLPIHPQTMSALLIWALRFVEDFSTDILAAHELRATPRQASPPLAALAPAARVRHYLQSLRDTTKTAPGMVLHNQPEMRCFAKSFIAWQLGIADDEVDGALFDRRLVPDVEPSEEANLPLPITGRIGGTTPWIDAINFYGLDTLSRHLSTAAFIVVAYLTGVRGEECRALEHGCCRSTTNPATGQNHFEIHGKTFKGALDKSGNTKPEGADRDHPWLAIAPVAKAIGVMESLHPKSRLLFPVEAFSAFQEQSTAGAAVHPVMLRNRITDFIQWCNDTATRLGRTAEIIPPDPEGRVVVKRFRRTLAWFIYRKPGGRIALGVQYGHLRGHTTDGYGSRVASGLRDVFPMEEALARAEYLEDAHTHLENGEQISGPAASRYTEAVRLYGQGFGGRYLSGKQAAALRANPQLRIYDNAAQFVTCCYDQSKALCHPDRLGPLGTDETPDINHCQPNCGNIARTDRNIEEAAAAVSRHDEDIASPMTPEPMRARLAQRVSALKAMIQTHNEWTIDP
jgi:hypothetical protein